MSNLNDTTHIHSSPATESIPLETAGMSDSSTKEFLDIFTGQKLAPVFQPIIDVSRAGIYGYEGLIRGPQGSRFETPLQLFKAATMLDVDRDFEFLCRKMVIQRFAELGLGHLLFINVSPVMLLSKTFQNSRTIELLQEYKVDARKIVIEVTEHRNSREYRDLNQALDHYRGLGFRVALDDLGSGYSSLRLWTELLPDYIKIDKHFVRNVHKSKVKQSFVRGLMEISAGSNCRLIAEGVETREEFEFLSGVGVNYLQGYYFAKPSMMPPESIDKQLIQIETKVHLSAGFTQNNLQGITHCKEPIAAGTRVRDVLETLQKNPEVDLLPIVDGEQPVGLVERFVFLNTLMSSLYGLDLYGKMRIIDFQKDEPVLADLNTNLEDASRAVTARPNTQAFIVTRHGKYFGVSTVIDLLHLITEQQICSARYANPLTLLPGIQPTNDAISRLLYAKTPFSLAYYDLDNFKPYNDHYGYDAGDQIIKQLADSLRSVYKKEFSLIGHIGGDDFVVVDMSRDAIQNCREVLARMESSVAGYYKEEHVVAGGIKGKDRLGNDSFFPLLSLSIGVVPPECTSQCSTHLQISDLAAQAKKLAKQQQGSSLFINARSG